MRWRSEFARAIPGDISLALAIRSQHLPKALFRYRSMTDLTLDNLRHGVEYLSAPDAFNDPFDSAAAVALEIHTESLLDHGADKLMQYLVEHHGVQWTDLDHIDVHRATHPFRRVVNMVLDRDPSFTGSKANFAQVLVSATEKVVGTTLSDHARSLVRNSFRIVCFSETYQSILMWSHYADQHRGFCIEYDFTADPWRSVVFPVAYQRSMPDVTESFLSMFLQPGVELDQPVRLAWPALVKAPAWAYEKEWRVILLSQFVQDPPVIRPPRPTRIYLGAATRDADVARLREHLPGSGNIPLYRMTLHPRAYKLVSQPLLAVDG